MKPNIFLLALIISITCTSVMIEPGEEPIFDSTHEPLFVSRPELENSIKILDKKKVERTGKIYSLPPYIFLIEQQKGIHIIDNSDIKNPLNLKFINFPGIIDLAVKNGILYGNNSVDLVGIDINDINSIEEVSRTRNFFPEPTPPDFQGSFYEPSGRPEGTIILAWKPKN